MRKFMALRARTCRLYLSGFTCIPSLTLLCFNPSGHLCLKLNSPPSRASLKKPQRSSSKPQPHVRHKLLAQMRVLLAQADQLASEKTPAAA